MATAASPPTRREDDALLRGRGCFVHDVAPPTGTLHLAMVRSAHAHARVLHLDLDAARRSPGVVAVLTARELGSGDFVATLDQACAHFGYEHECVLQQRRRSAGELVGIGVALYIEPCGQGWESARVTLHADGRVTVASGSPAQGQGHATTWAQIAARELGCAPEQVDVALGDTAHCPPGIGALASRSTAIGGSAIVQACRRWILKRRNTS